MPTTKSPKARNYQPRNPAREGAKQPLGAELWLKSQRPLSCAVTKLAHNHLVFVSLHDESQAPAQTSNETPGKLIILGAGHETPLAIPVRVNHHTRERWILEPQQGALNLLVKLKSLLQAPPEDCETSTARLTPFRRSELFRDGQKILDDFLHARFANFFSELDDRLLRAAASERDGQQGYQHAIDMAARQRQAFTAHYQQQVLALLAAAAQPDFVPQEPALSTESTSTARTSGSSSNLLQLAKQATTQNQASLDSLALHFSMTIRHLTEPGALPFSPAWLYHHFANTISVLEFPEATRHLLFQVFRDTVMVNIGPLYGRLDTFFCAQNSTKAAAQQFPPVLQQAVATPTDTDGHNRARPASPSIKLPCPQPAHAGKLLEAAGALHSALSAQAVDRSQLLTELFNSIIDDERVHDEARPLLRQIKAPLLSLAGAAGEFWVHNNHPARRCFGLIAILSRETWFRGGPVRRRLPSICERIQREWKVNPGLFDTVLPLLDDLLSRQQQASKRNVQRLAAKLDGQQRLHQAQRDVSTQLRLRFEGQPFPVALQQLIDQGWHQFMVHALVNQGPRSATYQHALVTLEQLHQTLVDDEPEAARRQDSISAAQLADKMLKPLESAGLASVQYQQALGRVEAMLNNPGKAPAMAADFSADTHSSLGPNNRREAQRSSTQANADEQSEQSAQREQAITDTIPTLQPASSDPLSASGRDDEGSLPLAPGEWLGWIDCPAEQAMQLAWSAADRSLHAFVDQAGTHLFDLSDTALAADRRLGLQRMADPWDNLPLEEELYQLVARHFAHLSTRFDQHYRSELLGPSTFEAKLATLARLATYSGKTHTLLGIQLEPAADTAPAGEHGAKQPCSATQTLISNLLNQLCPPDAIIARLDEDQGSDNANNSAHEVAGAGQASCHSAHQYYAALLPYTDVTGGQQLLVQLKDALANSQHLPGAPRRSHCGLLMVTRHSSPPTTLLKQLQESCTIPTATGAAAPAATPRSWVPRLGQILQQDRLKLRLQGSVATGRSHHSHYEILLGVIDERGQISLPGDLIAAAEQHQRMDIIDRWVIQQTLRWLEAHPQKTAELGRIHINLSANALRSHPFLTYLLTALDQGNIPNDALSFEVSATTASANLPRAADFIARIRHTGCHFALDHFGKGPESLALLRQLPVNMVKFDHTFSRDLVDHSVSRTLLAALTRAAHSLGMSTCAQGVEHEDVLPTLEALDIDYAQGFGVTKPILLEDA